MEYFSKYGIVLWGLILLFGINLDVYSQSDVKPEVKIINDSDLKMILEKGKGSPLLINVWATWCAPCREEFPELVTLAENYESIVKFIGISVDDVDDLDSKVIPFLQNQNAEFENYLLKIVEPEDFIDLLDEDWNGAIPATFIYDKNGKQIINLIGKQSYDEFEEAIKKVIN